MALIRGKGKISLTRRENTYESNPYFFSCKQGGLCPVPGGGCRHDRPCSTGCLGIATTQVHLAQYCHFWCSEYVQCFWGCD